MTVSPLPCKNPAFPCLFYTVWLNFTSFFSAYFKENDFLSCFLAVEEFFQNLFDKLWKNLQCYDIMLVYWI